MPATRTGAVSGYHCSAGGTRAHLIARKPRQHPTSRQRPQPGTTTTTTTTATAAAEEDGQTLQSGLPAEAPAKDYTPPVEEAVAGVAAAEVAVVPREQVVVAASPS
eukprot:Filipodium_phascolosomae@DN5074_c0_g1_i1.p2